MSLLNKKKRNRQKKKEKKDLHETEPLGKNDQTVFSMPRPVGHLLWVLCYFKVPRSEWMPSEGIQLNLNILTLWLYLLIVPDTFQLAFKCTVSFNSQNYAQNQYAVSAIIRCGMGSQLLLEASQSCACGPQGNSGEKGRVSMEMLLQASARRAHPTSAHKLCQKWMNWTQNRKQSCQHWASIDVQ